MNTEIINNYQTQDDTLFLNSSAPQNEKIIGIDSWFVDDFKDYKTTTLLGSALPTKLEKEHIIDVLNYLVMHYKPNVMVKNSDKYYNLIVEILNTNQPKYKKYDCLKANIKGCETNECLLLHVAKSYGIYPKSLLMDTIAIHSRIKKLDNKDAWFDNFSLNSYLLQMTPTCYSIFDDNSDPSIKSVISGITFTTPEVVPTEAECDLKRNLSGGNKYKNIRDVIYDLYFNNINVTGGRKDNIENLDFKNSKIDENINKSEIKKNPKLEEYVNDPEIRKKFINENIELTNPKQLLFHLGNNYRVFIEFGKTAEEVKDNDEAVKILDAFAIKYPYYTGCCHGCDVFTSDFRDKSVSINDIKEFCNRYPLNIVGYILNTKTYKSGRGQHWVAIIFKGNTCYMICSQGGGFNSFEETSFEEDLNKAGFAKEWNTKVIQHDNSSCGMYSVLANLSFIINGSGIKKPNINEIVDLIGNDGKNINKFGIYSIKKKLAGF